MIGALASLLLIAGAALIVGQALAALSSGATRERPAAASWLAAPLGMAALLVLGGMAIRLPGHGTTAAMVLALAILASALYLRGRVAGVVAGLILAAPVVAITALAASVPFALAGQVGILGVGLVNDDMASHLIIADYVGDPGAHVPSFIEGGYPIGPHSVAAAVAAATGADLVEVFAGLTLALAGLLGIAGWGLLEGLPRLRRLAGACLIALSYLAAAYLAQGAFKEPLMSLLLVGFTVSLAALIGLECSGAPGAEPDARPAVHPLLGILPVGVFAAAVVFTYSLPGLLWIGAVALAVVLARLLLVKPRPQLPAGWARRLAPYALGLLAVLAVATVQEWSRIADFSRLSALNPDRFGSQLGNLRGSLSPLEALGIWPSGEYRLSASAASLPAAAFYAGAAVAGAALVVGIVTALRERRPALATATVAALGVWALLALIGSPYIAAKALAIAAPLVIAVALRGTLGGRGAALVLGAVVVVAAAGSTFLVLRQAPVGPGSHAGQLAELRAVVEDEDVLFLGRDDFIAWELRGSGEITGVVTNFYDVEDTRPRFKKGKGGGEKFDVDAVFPRTLDEFRYVLATAGGPASRVPPRFEVAAETPDYVLYERTAGTGKRTTLREGTEPGARLSGCRTAAVRRLLRRDGTATVWDPEPVIEEAGGWAPSAEPSDGAPASQRLRLPAAGRWLISLEYDSRRPLQVSAPGIGLEATVAANLDFRGESPTFPVGEVEVNGPVSAEVVVEPERPNGLAGLVGAPNEAHLRSLTATPVDPGAITRMPLREACAAYVDWYRAR